MNLFRKSALAALLLCVLTSQASASIVIRIVAGRLDGADGSSPVGAGTLLQLVNLGADGVFNPITLADGDISQTGQWVSGDDSLVNLSYLVDGSAGDFASAAAFDLMHSSSAEPTTGVMSRVFDFASQSIPIGSKLGLRWFPGIQASDFQSSTLTIGQAYGQFTRQTDMLHNGAAWEITFQDGTVTFDSLATTEIGGSDSAAAGNASFTVIPEPAVIGLSLLGAAGLGMLRRRRA